MQMNRGLVLAAVAVVLFSGTTFAADKTKDLIVGKWEASIKFKVGDEEKVFKVTLEFSKDGKVTTVAPNGKEQKATYKVVDETNIEVTAKMGDEDKTTKIKVKVTKDELEITGPGGKATKFKRVTKKKETKDKKEK